MYIYICILFCRIIFFKTVSYPFLLPIGITKMTNNITVISIIITITTSVSNYYDAHFEFSETRFESLYIVQTNLLVLAACPPYSSRRLSCPPWVFSPGVCTSLWSPTETCTYSSSLGLFWWNIKSISYFILTNNFQNLLMSAWS